MNQSVKHHYTLEQIQRLGARWITEAVFGGFQQRYVQAEQQRTGKVRRFYQRVFPPLVTLWLMLSQRLSADHSCDAAVSARISSQPVETALRMSESSSAYCQARQRLPLAVIQDSLKHAAGCLREELGAAALWYGREVVLLDGSTLRLSATEELKEHYGVSRNQHGENHWPLMRLLTGFDLFTGGVEAAAEAPYAVGEQSLVAQLMEAVDAHKVWVGDMNFGNYRTVQVAVHFEQDVAVRVQKDRARHLAGGEPMVSGEDRDVVWSGAHQPRAEKDWDTSDIPGRLLYFRIERPGFRPIDLYIFTTLTDRVAFPAQAILALYGRRWNVELNLRHLKSTLQMEELAGKSVEIVRKELWVGLLAYTLIRGWMGLAAVRVRLDPLGLSFVRSLRRIRDTAPRLTDADTPSLLQDAWDFLLARVGKCTLPRRTKTRFEPRQVWGKPRVFPTIKGSRDQARALELAKLALPIS